MISLGPILVAALIVMLIAAGNQAWARRGRKRPLARHAVNRRSPDDPPLGMEATDLRVMHEALRKNARLTDQFDGKWPWLKQTAKRSKT